jgi:hypothetical protein
MIQRDASWVWLAIWVAAGCAGTRHLDPPPPPAAVMPQVALPPPPAPGTGRVIVDVVDGRAEVQIRTMQPGGAQWRPMCATPCVIDLFPGRVEASFLVGNHGDTDFIDVPPGTSVYRRQLLERDESPVLLVAGYTVGYFGILTAFTGLMISAIENVDNTNRTTTHVGRNVGLVGVGMSIAGGLMFYYGWPTVRPAAVTQFAVPPQ